LVVLDGGEADPVEQRISRGVTERLRVGAIVQLRGVDILEAKLDAAVVWRGPDPVGSLQLAVAGAVIGDETHRISVRLITGDDQLAMDAEKVRRSHDNVSYLAGRTDTGTSRAAKIPRLWNSNGLPGAK